MVYVGHLDLMRYYQKAIRRAQIPIMYSQGFNPHQIMSFAQPLGIGVEGYGEYFDIEVSKLLPSKQITDQLNAVMTEGNQILAVKLLEDSAKTSMSLITAGDYELTLQQAETSQEQLQDKINSCMQQENIMIMKKTKRSEMMMDLKPMIYSIYAIAPDKISMRLATGSSGNLNPSYVMEAIFKEDVHFTIARHELYTTIVDEDGNETLLPLEETGIDIV